MVQEFQVKLPMRMQVNKRGETESLNLNIYRNLHFYQLSYQKNAFHKKMQPALRGLPKLGKVKLHYEIHPKTQGRLDTMNVGSVVDKFFSDALVESGVIEDDDYNNVVFNSFCFGSVSPKDPHVLVTITEIEPRRNEIMRVLLDQNEIQQALEDYVQTMGLPGVSALKFALNEKGNLGVEVILATAMMTTANNQPDNVSSIIRPKRGGRPVGSKNKPKEEGRNVAASGEGSYDSDSAGSTESSEETDPDTSSDDEQEDDDTNVTTLVQPETTPRKNLFGDSDEGSAIPETSEKEDPIAEVPVTPVAKKSSIFDE